LKTWLLDWYQVCAAPGRRETMLAKIISEMPLPMPCWVISSPIHITSTVPAVSEITISRMCWRSNVGMIDPALVVESEWKRKT
jgi:hypothetical protein